ncbi:hypothetical protein SERLADRAFT_459652 [Serpula lacrymans var. lacrymans S7.9]|uniref:Uncharacterized protein n=1 Tax=Serpula lacrymans var. lacrymans (strain S7.9) TaxID=578457 RepID=F8NKV2_SERL9|nr:uncharacterized protein SERLADRAFT_459652 [Serpula lacrymans var. lacrymans S7.9]EGO28821.1 hypothetical protein SERLADRAFT_459652 [Serpula lacrymans var. lacrymans S7.9]
MISCHDRDGHKVGLIGTDIHLAASMAAVEVNLLYLLNIRPTSGLEGCQDYSAHRASRYWLRESPTENGGITHDRLCL